MSNQTHYHMFAVCRECGPNLSGPTESISDIANTLEETKRMAQTDSRATLVGMTRSVVEFTMRTDKMTHEYVVTYIHCHLDYETCETICALTEAVKSGKLEGMLEEVLNSFIAEHPEAVERLSYIKPPTKGFNSLNN